MAPLGVSACVTAQSGASQVVLTPDAFATWLERYKQAWEQRDAQRAGALFTVDATYHEMPFDAPMQGRAAIEAYWTRVTAGQSDIRFGYDVLGCEGDRGVCHWHATFTGVPGGEAIELDGIFVCHFADATAVQSLTEWWHIRVTPAAGATG